MVDKIDAIYDREHRINARRRATLKNTVSKLVVEFFDYLVFIGRFQPPHFGHFHVVLEALKRAKRRVYLLIGSANRAPDSRNPLSFEQRVALWTNCGVPEIEQAIKNGLIEFIAIDDWTYMDEKWTEQVRTKVHAAVAADSAPGEEPTIGLIGWKKDNTSYYLKKFPTWGSIGVTPERPMSATTIRDILFNDQSSLDTMLNYTTPEIVERLTAFANTERYRYIKADHDWNQKNKQIWSSAPYPPTFNTVDAVVIRSAHVLLIRRKNYPQKGFWALPGGYLNQEETLADGAIRELIEETALQLIPKNHPGDRKEALTDLLKAHIVKSETFDDPFRSLRGRVVTHAFLIQLPNGPLPKVKGSDDAEKAQWVPLEELKCHELMEDHYFIIKKLTGGL
jgi:bifunctional NMN adenylyltransferase/nudix hydrolase